MNDSVAAKPTAAQPVAAQTATIQMSPKVFEDKARNAAQLILSAAEMTVPAGTMGKGLAAEMLKRSLDLAISQYQTYMILVGVYND